MLARTLGTAAALVALFVGPGEAWSQSVEDRLAALERQVAELRALHNLPPAPPAGTVVLPAELTGNLHVRWGYPGGRCTLLVKEFFVVCYDAGRRVPEWVTYLVTREELAAGDVERTDDFRPDPVLAPGDRAELVDYRNSGYDRGHMAPAEDFDRSLAAMSSTFLLTNMTPQRPNMNRGILARLEGQIRQLVNSHGRAWVITGALFVDGQGNPVAPQDSIGPNAVAVPSHVYKVILCEHATGAHEMFAFILPNNLTPVPGQPVSYLVSVDQVERWARLNFFDALPDDVENPLERQVATSWPVP